MKKIKKEKSKTKKGASLENLYLRTFKTNNNQNHYQNRTLEQPHALEFVDSVTTYGAYQEPI